MASTIASKHAGTQDARDNIDSAPQEIMAGPSTSVINVVDGSTPQKATTTSSPAKDDASLSDATPPFSDEATSSLPADASEFDDGWEAVPDPTTGTWSFFNRFTGVTTTDNPRVPGANTGGYTASTASYDYPATCNTATSSIAAHQYTSSYATSSTPAYYYTSSYAASTVPAIDYSIYGSSAGVPASQSKRVAGGYNPAIHGSYDPTAPYALEREADEEREEQAAYIRQYYEGYAPDVYQPNSNQYGTTLHINRYTNNYQPEHLRPENYDAQAQSGRQMNAFFDVNGSANEHDGRSLKEERRNKQVTKKQVKAWKKKKEAKQESRRRALYMD